MVSSEQIKTSLLHTWPVFFAQHGSLTHTQQQTIPPILAGQDTLVIAATASGKTEAVVAPLVERVLREQYSVDSGHYSVNSGQSPISNPLLLLYFCPTRALVRDLYERLKRPFSTLHLPLAIKTGDTGPLKETPALLITTPESTDSLLTRQPRLFTHLQAIVLDEIHLLDGSPRGDHVRCLLARLERIQQFVSQPPAQRIALSATISDPQGVADRYLNQPAIVQVEGSRPLEADILPLYSLADLATALTTRHSKKTLIFCNVRYEVEQVAAYLRRNLPFETAVFIHYSNLDKTVRQETEQGFAQASTAICVCTSTLELGIDIGSVEDVILIGPPPTLTSFLQRIGRGGRRTNLTRVLCLPRSPLEYLHFEALLSQALSPSLLALRPSSPFRPSVLIQQTFSFLKQSPTASIRQADLRRLAPANIPNQTLADILNHLTQQKFLSKGRFGEWKPNFRLNELTDEHEIYSNIGGEALKITVVDAYSGRKIAQTARSHRLGEMLLMGGRLLEVIWQDRHIIGVQPGKHRFAQEQLPPTPGPFAVPAEIAQGMATQLGLLPGQLPLLIAEDGIWLFHFWGDVYGELLTAVLHHHYPPADDQPSFSPWNEICLRLPFSLTQLPAWDEAIVEQVVVQNSERLAQMVEIGRFHPLLPPALATQTILHLCQLPQLASLWQSAVSHPFLTPSPTLHQQLLALL